MSYPICSKSFKTWLSKSHIYEIIYKSIGSPRPFDVSLRDGIQSIPIHLHQNYTTNEKMKIYNDIINQYNPESIEIGSLVSPKVLPVLGDSIELYNRCTSLDYKLDHYLLVPSITKMSTVIDLCCKNISLITSVSEAFQLRNTKKDLVQTKKDISEIISKAINCKIKLYISCIDHCPIVGKIPHDIICNEIMYYYKNFNLDNLCLSDTCGTLTNESFISIIDKCKSLGLSYNSLSLHLHTDPKSETSIINTKQIIYSALDRKISRFDVSYLETGGCSVTMGSKTKPNLSYNLYYMSLVNYIIDKSNNKN
jgi:hypothetical protein